MGFARKSLITSFFMDRGEIIESGDADAFFTAARTPRAQTFLAKILSLISKPTSLRDDAVN